MNGYVTLRAKESKADRRTGKPYTRIPTTTTRSTITSFYPHEVYLAQVPNKVQVDPQVCQQLYDRSNVRRVALDLHRHDPATTTVHHQTQAFRAGSQECWSMFQ